MAAVKMWKYNAAQLGNTTAYIYQIFSIFQSCIYLLYQCQTAEYTTTTKLGWTSSRQRELT